MGIENKMILVLLLSPGCMLAVHMICSRVSRNASRQVTAFKAACLGILPVGAILWFFSFRHMTGTIQLVSAISYCLILYGLFTITYFHFFNMSETARRIRILSEIDRAGLLPAEEMAVLYKSADIISIRLARMVAMKQLKCEDGYYSVDGKMLYWSAIMIFTWRRLLGFEK